MFNPITFPITFPVPPPRGASPAPPSAAIVIDPWHIHRAVIGAIYLSDWRQLREMRQALRVLRDIYPPHADEHVLIHAHVAGIDAALRGAPQ